MLADAEKGKDCSIDLKMNIDFQFLQVNYEDHIYVKEISFRLLLFRNNGGSLRHRGKDRNRPPVLSPIIDKEFSGIVLFKQWFCWNH
ncbi:unnamed protein product [Trifolium pratense]|uniref:Uncharacterized protein n=1 Tax=Trifolium pratense TaxID=57577 RepID=A0ACB0LWD8_TRIPR|nr:unnamed protein product [Trifolium pratense]